VADHGALTDATPTSEDAPMSASLADLSMATQEERTAVWMLMANAGPVFQIPGGAWMVTSPEGVQYIHRNPELFSSVGLMGAGELPIQYVPSAVDPPEHRRYRRILDPMLAPRVINAMEDDLRGQVRDLVSAFAGRGSCDAVAELAIPYPTTVFLSVFGLPVEDRDRLISWVKTMIEKSPQLRPEFTDEYNQACWDIYGYLLPYVEAKRDHPGDDMLSRILTGDGDDTMSVEEVLGMCILFSLAGLDTVTGAVGFMLFYLARNPELRRRIIADPALVNPMIEEVLRLEPPAPMFPRTTTQDVEVCGVSIPAGQRVMMCLAAVNRSPDTYDEPDAIDLDQADRGHVTFGGGVHRCLGSHLARREMRLVMEEFHRQIPEYEIAGGFEPEIMWPSGTLHLRSLPLVFPVGADSGPSGGER
jgi:cytochrome P450